VELVSAAASLFCCRRGRGVFLLFGGISI